MQRGSSVVISGKQGMQKVKVQFCIASLNPRPSDLWWRAWNMDLEQTFTGRGQLDHHNNQEESAFFD